jgi:hypothetical protein
LTLCYIVPVMVAGVNPAYQPPTDSADSILPMLVQKLMPIGLGGIFLAALVAASNSTASSYLNSLATLFERDLYRPSRPDRSTKHYLLVGRMVTVLAGGIGLAYAILCSRSDVNLLSAAWTIGSIFQPAIFVVIAGALFFRRGTTAGASACLILGIGYAAIGALGGWAALGKSLQLTDWPFFSWDHTKPPTRALVGMPWSAAVLMIVSLCTAKWASDENRAAEHAVWLNRMRFAPGNWTPRRAAGFVTAAICLVGMIAAAIFDRNLPKPWNVPLFLGLLSGFVAGLLLAAGRFLPAEETEKHTRAAIEDSRFARYLATGWTWAAVYAVATLLVVVLYLAG